MSVADRASLAPRIRFGVSSAPLEEVLERGEGVHVTTRDGRRLLDLFAGAGICSLGHGHRRYAAAVSGQLARLCVARGDTGARRALVELLGHCLPPGLSQLGFFSSGAEAIEAALRICREASGATDVVVLAGAFHGRTAAAALASDPRLAGRPGDPPHIHRLPFPALGTGGLGELEAAANALRETPGPARVAAVVVEPIQGSAGNRIAEPGFLALLRELADDLGVALVCDEVITGCGRTGSLFRCEEEGAEPDVLVLGKGMANGMPCSMIATRPALAERSGLDRRLTSTSFGGNPLAMAAAGATLATILDEGLVAGAAEVGKYWADLLERKLAPLPIVERVRGAGLLIGVELTPSAFEAGLDGAAVAGAMAAEGLLVGVGGTTIRLNPPLVFSEEDARAATAALERGLQRLGAAGSRGRAGS